MTSANEQLRDRYLEHDIGLQRLSNATVRKVIAELERLRLELERQVRERIGWIADRGFDSSDFTLRRLEANLDFLDSTLREAYRAIGQPVRRELYRAGQYEEGWVGGSIAKAVGLPAADLGIRRLAPEVLKAIIDSRPFQGRLLSEWYGKLAADAAARVRTSIRTGLLLGEGVDRVVIRTFGRAVRVDGKWRRRGGSFDITTREAETVVRTAMMHTLTSARSASLQSHARLLRGKRWVTTLDDRTCTECAPRDGLLYTLDGKPIGHKVPYLEGPGRLHPRDRCSERPEIKSARELGLAGYTIPGRMRESLDGRVAASTTFADFARAGGYERWVTLFGKRRADLIRAGELEIPELWDDRGEWLTLDELIEREAA